MATQTDSTAVTSAPNKKLGFAAIIISATGMGLVGTFS